MYILQDGKNVWCSIFNGDVVEVTMTSVLQRQYDVITRQLQVSEEDTQHGTDNNLGAGGSELSISGGQGSGTEETRADHTGGQVLQLCEGKRRPPGVSQLRTVSITQETQEAKLEGRRDSCAKLEGRRDSCAKLEGRRDSCAKLEGRGGSCAKLHAEQVRQNQRLIREMALKKTK